MMSHFLEFNYNVWVCLLKATSPSFTTIRVYYIRMIQQIKTTTLIYTIT